MNLFYLESAEKLVFYKGLKRRLETAINYFPELDDNMVYVGECHPSKHGQADYINNMIMVTAKNIPGYATIFHELMHLVQHKVEGIPGTEEACSIFAMARMPPELVENCVIPYVHGLENGFDKKLIPKLCIEALEYRAEGHRDYIKYLVCLIKDEERNFG